LEQLTELVAELVAEDFAECLDGQEETPARTLSIWKHRGQGLRRPRSGRGDEDIHTHNTLSAENTEVRVFYPFHPLYGATVQILRKPKRGDGAVSVIDHAGKRLKIPVWMLSPDSSGIRISERVHLRRKLFSL
jgi:hypothetical protein